MNNCNNSRDWFLAFLLSIPLTFGIIVSYLAAGNSSVGAINIVSLALYFAVGSIVLFMSTKLNSRWISFLLFLCLIDVLLLLVTEKGDFKYLYYEINRYVGLLLLVPVLSSKLNYRVFLRTLIIFYIIYNLLNLLYVNSGEFTRSANVTGSSFNSIASIDLIGLPIIIYSLINIKLSRIDRFCLIFCHILICLMILLSGSRIAYPILLVLLLFELFSFRKKIGFFKSILILGAFVGLFLFVILKNDTLITSMTRATAEGFAQDDARETMWLSAIETLNSSGWIIGTGQPLVSDSLSASDSAEAHNFILEILLQSGIIGFIIFLSYHFKIIKFVRNTSRSRKRPQFSLFIFLTVLPFFGMAFFHPIITTSITYNYLYVFSLVYMFLLNSNNEVWKEKIALDTKRVGV